MNQYVAVDGGQSGLRLRASDGRVGYGPGFHYQGRHSTSAVTSAVVRAAAEAEVRGPIAVLCAGLSGLPVEPERQRTLALALSDRLDITEVRLTSDVVTAHAGALPDRPGVVVAAGTGAVSLAVDDGGRVRRSDGWGHLFGDVGSAFDIGRRAITAVYRTYDGRGMSTALSRTAEEWFGVGPDRLHQWLYRSATVVSDVAGFAPSVAACAEAGDAVAGRILAEAGEELARTVSAAMAGLEFPDDEVPVAAVGRLWEVGTRLAEPFTAELARRDARASMVPPVGDGLAGAERLACSALGRYEDLVVRHAAAELRGGIAAGRVDSGGNDWGEAAEPSDPAPPLPFPRGSLIVSCQAQPDSPLFGPQSMAAMAQAATAGGAAGVRVNGEADIAAARAVVDGPVIGLVKQGSRAGVYITPTVAAAEAVVRAGADIVALDGTTRPRLDGVALAEQIAMVHRHGVLVMADVDSLQAGIAARDAGADLVATSLAGYTGVEQPPDEPDLELLGALVGALDCPVIAEGRYRTAADMQAASEQGAFAVVIGTAITNPTAITRRILDR